MRWAAAAKNAPFLLGRIGASSLSSYSRAPSFADAHGFAACDRVLSVIGTVPDFESQLDFLSPIITSAVVVEVLAHNPGPRLAFRFYSWASRQRHLRSWASYNQCIYILRSPGGFDSAWCALAELKQKDVSAAPAAFTALISAYSTSGQVEKAVETFGRMPEFGSRPNTFAYNTMLQIFVDKDVIFLALAVYNQMIKSDCWPNRSTYVILMTGLCKAGKTEDARLLFDEMLHRGISPNTAVYTVFLSSLCKANRLDEASALLESMKQKNCKPDLVTYHALLNGFCKSGKIGEAFEHLRRFKEDGFVLGLSSYSCLIDGLFKAGRFEEARRHYQEMLENDVVPDLKLYTIMIRGYVENGKVEESFSFLSEMTRDGLVPDTFCYNTLIKGLCDIGHLNRARSLVLEISQNDQFVDSVTYTIMICGLCNAGLVDEAQNIFNEMENHGCIPTVITFNSLINGLCKARKMEEASILFYKMEMGRNPSLYLRLSQGANKIHNKSNVRQMVEEMCQSGHVLKAYKLLRSIIDCGVVPDIVTYNILINGLCKAGNLDGAMKLLKEAHLRGLSPDSVTYGTLFDGLLKVHKQEEAFALLQQSVCTLSRSVYNTLMRRLCGKKKVLQAVTLWLNYLSQNLPEEADTIATVRKLFMEGNLEETIRGLVELDQHHSVAGPLPYTIWLIGFCQVNMIDEAFLIFRILMQAKIDPTPPSCAFLIRYLCRSGKLGSALDVMYYTLEKGFFFSRPVGNHLLRKLCFNNCKVAARELAETMHFSGYDMGAYLRPSTKVLLYNRPGER